MAELLRDPGPEEKLGYEKDVGGNLVLLAALKCRSGWMLTVSRLVSKVPKPRDFRFSVRYEVIGVEGINHVRPSMKIGHIW